MINSIIINSALLLFCPASLPVPTNHTAPGSWSVHGQTDQSTVPCFAKICHSRPDSGHRIWPQRPNSGAFVGPSLCEKTLASCCSQPWLCVGMAGIGQKRALELILKHGSLERVLANIDSKKYNIPEPFPYKEARELFRGGALMHQSSRLADGCACRPSWAGPAALRPAACSLTTRDMSRTQIAFPADQWLQNLTGHSRHKCCTCQHEKSKSAARLRGAFRTFRYMSVLATRQKSLKMAACCSVSQWRKWVCEQIPQSCQQTRYPP